MLELAGRGGGHVITRGERGLTSRMTTRQGEKNHKDRPERHPDEPKHHDYEVTFSRLMAAVFVLVVVAVRLQGMGVGAGRGGGMVGALGKGG